MSRRNEIEMAYVKNEWVTRMKDPLFRKMSWQEQAEDIGDVAPVTLKRWFRDVEKERPLFWQEVLEGMRVKEQRSRQSVMVRDALLGKALGGDVQAQKLWLQVEEGWSEKQISENINKNGDLENMGQEELKAAFLKSLSKDDLEKALKEKEIRVVEPGNDAGRTGT